MRKIIQIKIRSFGFQFRSLLPKKIRRAMNEIDISVVCVFFNVSDAQSGRRPVFNICSYSLLFRVDFELRVLVIAVLKLL